MFKNLKQNVFKELKENMVIRSEVMGNPAQMHAVGQGDLGIFQTAFAQSSLIYTLLYSQFQRFLVPSVAVPFQNSILTGLVFTFAADRISPTASIHRLPCGLPGYLILFDTHTFEPQRQYRLSMLPSQSEFFVISKHFTATPRIPHTSTALKDASINCSAAVEPQPFTTDLTSRLRSL